MRPFCTLVTNVRRHGTGMYHTRKRDEFRSAQHRLQVYTALPSQGSTGPDRGFPDHGTKVIPTPLTMVLRIHPTVFYSPLLVLDLSTLFQSLSQSTIRKDATVIV
ncbi:hypothetical protein J6590_045845 [Homalodisca vitripennis]|nr:hypothetical protein J6590_045845 [Homalodisca vitripennis]